MRCSRCGWRCACGGSRRLRCRIRCSSLLRLRIGRTGYFAGGIDSPAGAGSRIAAPAARIPYFGFLVIDPLTGARMYPMYDKGAQDGHDYAQKKPVTLGKAQLSVIRIFHKPVILMVLRRYLCNKNAPGMPGARGKMYYNRKE